MRLSVLRGGSRKSDRGGAVGLGLSLAAFACQQFDSFGKALSVKLHDKINGIAAFALAVAIPFVSPDGQAVVPLPAVFISGTGKAARPVIAGKKQGRLGWRGLSVLGCNT